MLYGCTNNYLTNPIIGHFGVFSTVQTHRITLKEISLILKRQTLNKWKEQITAEISFGTPFFQAYGTLSNCSLSERRAKGISATAKNSARIFFFLMP